MKSVSNPLTIIAIFAGLAEVAGTVALAALEPELQGIFIWFVMGFPIFLVVAFFITLNFNPKVLYAPSDFRDEENFLNTLIGSQRASAQIEETKSQLEAARIEIVDQVVRDLSNVSDETKENLSQLVSKQLDAVKKQLEATRESVAQITEDAVTDQFAYSETQANIINVLKQSGLPVGSVAAIAGKIGMSYSATLRACERLQKRGAVELDTDANDDDIVALVNVSPSSPSTATK